MCSAIASILFRIIRCSSSFIHMGERLEDFSREVESIVGLCAEGKYSEGWKRLLALEEMPQARFEPVRVRLRQVRERLHEESVNEWHVRMLNDGARNVAYKKAIAEAMRDKEGQIDRVIDVGCGTGILSYYLAECAPKGTEITACDCSWALCEVARRACGPRVKVIQADSADLVLEAPADMVVAELMDCALLGEGFLDVVRDLRRRGQVKEEALVIPERGTVYGCVVESDVIRERNLYVGENVRLEDGYGSIHGRGGFQYRALTNTFRVCSADFGSGQVGGLGVREVEVREGGECACVLVWWEATLYGDIRINSVKDCDWDYAVFPCPRRKVEEGETIRVRVAYEESKLTVEFDGSYAVDATEASEFDIMTASSIRKRGCSGYRSGDLSRGGLVLDLTGVGHSIAPYLLAEGFSGSLLSWMPREGDGLWSLLRDQLVHFRISPEDFAKHVCVVEANSQREFVEEIQFRGLLSGRPLERVIFQPVLPWGEVDPESWEIVTSLRDEVAITPSQVISCKGCWTGSAAVRTATVVEERSVPETIREEVNRGELLRVDMLKDFPLEDLQMIGEAVPLFGVDVVSGEVSMSCCSTREGGGFTFGSIPVRIPEGATGLVLQYTPSPLPVTGRCVIPCRGEGGGSAEIRVAWASQPTPTGMLWVEIVDSNPEHV